MPFRFRALKAKQGDCLILESGSDVILVDGGPPGVFTRYLEGALQTMSNSGGEDPLSVKLAMVSHIDSDHIAGLLELTRRLIEEDENDAKPLLVIDNAWHNSFSDLIAKTPKLENTAAAEAAAAGDALSELLGSTLKEDDAKLVLESVKQGREFRLDLKRLAIAVNEQFTRGFVLRGEQKNAPSKFGSFEVEVVGPTRKELDALEAAWAKELPKILAKDEDKAVALAAAKELEGTVSNLASIVCIVSAGGKRALLTGDSRGHLVVEWLKAAGKMNDEGTVHFDILKLPHHGSHYDVNLDFFRTVLADHYVVSGDGKYGNPEPSALQMLFDARPKGGYTIHMTYSDVDLAKHVEYKGNAAMLMKVLNGRPGNVTVKVPTTAEIVVAL